LLNKPSDFQAFKDQATRRLLEMLWDGDFRVLMKLKEIKELYIRWYLILKWFHNNNIRGKKILDFFKNHSAEDDGGGTLSGIAYILSRVDGKRYNVDKIKLTELH